MASTLIDPCQVLLNQLFNSKYIYIDETKEDCKVNENLKRKRIATQFDASESVELNVTSDSKNEKSEEISTKFPKKSSLKRKLEDNDHNEDRTYTSVCDHGVKKQKKTKTSSRAPNFSNFSTFCGNESIEWNFPLCQSCCGERSYVKEYYAIWNSFVNYLDKLYPELRGLSNLIPGETYDEKVKRVLNSIKEEYGKDDPTYKKVCKNYLGYSE